MSAPFLMALHGQLTVIGKSPDGDSMRFIPDTPDALQELARADRIRITKTDGSVQLRLEGIDSPETHFGPFAQPLGDVARDWLLDRTGFSDVTFDSAGKVTAATPATRRAVVLSKAADPNGRPISYLLVDHDDPPPDGKFVEVDAELVRATLNAASLAESISYLTLYSSTPARHRRTLRAIASDAREQQRGVWATDDTDDFELVDHDSLGPPDGELVLPKLFRRCSDYLKARQAGFQGVLTEWLVAVSATGRRPENDLLLIGGKTEVAMSTVLQHLNDRIRFTADILDIVFVEK
ncbi:MAG TPA: thermonuclease family protein [Solirubrobacteraceae bacterium]|nr:thermonuclease family protein [Solirubrobacteraceae bacterium]